MDPNNSTTNSSGPVNSGAAINPAGAAPSQNTQANPLPANPAISQPQSAQTTPPMQHPKGKSMKWMVLLLLFAFLCGLAIAAWYFQTQIQKY